jgi:hypothetical protein
VKSRIMPGVAILVSMAMVTNAIFEASVRIVREGVADFVWNWGLAETSIAFNFAVVGGVLAARRPRNPIGWLLLLQAWQAVASLIGVDAVIAVPWSGVLAATVLLFPHGRPMSQLWNGMLWIVAAVSAVILVSDRLGIRVGARPVWDVLEPVLLIALAAGVVALVLRYRRSVGVERLQLRALTSACILAVLGLFVSAPLGLLPIVNAVAIPAVAWGLALAVLRYRLYDLDRLISRTVSYGLLSLALGGVYTGVVFGTQAVFRPAATSDLAVAVATLTVAGLFAPLRRRLQRAVDRRFNRARYDAASIVAAFAADLRDQLDTHALVGGLTDSVEATVRPATTWVWLPTPGSE